MYSYLIIGSGLYGATIAQQFYNAGKKILVIEKRSHIAGNTYTEDIEGLKVHKYGAHIFHTNNKAVWDYVQQFATFNRFTNSPVANYHGELYSLPFNMYTFNKMWGVVTPEEAEQKIAEQRKAAGTDAPKNLEEQAISLVGTDIYEKLIKGYTQKQWGRPCNQLPAFIIKRSPVRLTFDNNYFNALYQGQFIFGVKYAPLRSSFIGVERREQREEVKDVLLSTGGSDELHIALAFVKYLCDQQPDGRTYHILLGAMNQDKAEIRSLAAGMDYIFLHENVQDMRHLICSMDVIVSAAGSTLYEICACGVPLITFSTADNQVPGAEAFENLGLAVNIGDLRDPTSINPSAVISGTLSSDAVERIMEAEEDLDVDTRISMVRHQRETIDGMGAKRLSERLIEKEEIRTI